MRAATTLGALSGIALLSCGGPGIAGGYTVAPGREPIGIVRARFDQFKCTDESGASVPLAPRLLEWIDLPGSRTLVVEYRDDLDSLVVDNSFEEGETKVYQVALLSDGGRPHLRDYRIDEGGQRARIVVTDKWQEEAKGDGFVGHLLQKPLTCESPASAGGLTARLRTVRR